MTFRKEAIQDHHKFDHAGGHVPNFRQSANTFCSVNRLRFELHRTLNQHGPKQRRWSRGWWVHVLRPQFNKEFGCSTSKGRRSRRQICKRWRQSSGRTSDRTRAAGRSAGPWHSSSSSTKHCAGEKLSYKYSNGGSQARRSNPREAEILRLRWLSKRRCSFHGNWQSGFRE